MYNKSSKSSKNPIRQDCRQNPKQVPAKPDQQIANTALFTHSSRDDSLAPRFSLAEHN